MQRYAPIVRELADRSVWSYQPGSPSSSEPAAWSCLALASHKNLDAARQPAEWLKEIQSADGSVGVSGDQQTPAWPTSLAIAAWNYLDQLTGQNQFSRAIARAVDWSLQARGKDAPRQKHIGHDTTLTGWSWAANTHSWVEPTAMFVIALKAVGHSSHPRTREAVRLVIDRLLPQGGCNYGNTIVLGQPLLAHVQPTGLAMLALAGETATDPRIGLSLDYLHENVHQGLATASLCYGVMGLAAHGRSPAQGRGLFETAPDLRQSAYKLALIALATCGHLDWLPSVNRSLEAPLL